MASGRMEFHAQSIMQHANFAYVLPNDVEMEEGPGAHNWIFWNRYIEKGISWALG